MRLFMYRVTDTGTYTMRWSHCATWGNAKQIGIIFTTRERRTAVSSKEPLEIYQTT